MAEVAAPSTSVVFICTSNTCRSPMAEAWARQWITECHPRASHITVSSMALSDAYEPPGSAASPHAVSAMQRRGMDLTRHRSRLVNEALVKQADILVCVTARHERLLRDQFPHIDVPIHVFAQDVPDPWHRDLAAYEACAAQLHKQLQVLLPSLHV
ncbi:hypothetical protein H310_11364 [Aphanomyces invadans]|uniref:acid phosphatase n=1 Tax=Aphanomyces invadans TaxID=157072 RepID=A0A024TLN1_9STRA|nr:hypothetical protein H310_11364 [Aphanomyces invadans]ETV95070.1 hypothetical protein H310_11364 [Aphanomyces invadans]|eukprot:XP_008876243.1 hypothetical protein H310_11364 [Aphanomyces invadans]